MALKMWVGIILIFIIVYTTQTCIKIMKKSILLFIVFFILNHTFGQEKNGLRVDIDYSFILFDNLENVAVNIKDYSKEYKSGSKELVDVLKLISDKLEYNRKDVFQLFFYQTNTNEIKVLINHINKSLAKREKEELEYVFYQCVDGCNNKDTLYNIYEVNVNTSEIKRLPI